MRFQSRKASAGVSDRSDKSYFRLPSRKQHAWNYDLSIKPEENNILTDPRTHCNFAHIATSSCMVGKAVIKEILGRGVACTREIKIACTRERLGGEDRMYTRIGNVYFLLVKTNENRDLWCMWRFYLQPCVEVGGSRLSVRPRSQLHTNRKCLYWRLSLYLCIYLSI